MDILFCLLKTIACYIVFILIGANLLGIIVRSFIAGNILTLVICIGVAFFYLYGVNHLFNWGVTLAAAILLIARWHDLIFEIRTGVKVSSNFMPKRPIDYFFTTFYWITPPWIFYSICYLA